MKRKMLLILVTLALTGCAPGLSPPAGGPPSSGTAASWPYELVIWKGHTYRVTGEAVTEIGQPIGQVTQSSDDETSRPNGTFSNGLPVGTRLFAIPGVPTDAAFAVQTKEGGYVKAVETGVYEPNGH
ncbi:hypothetical protein [Alicyclobacillus macrosporangiidus]|uniref:hypothetical protein n=1 Tax=Alicyclobacillus macrosporangiidus TaxID=392015 RepID=UPI00068947F4|nr:hypothetical protein [Alicyclobacillus macrosporangiidus]